MVDSAGKPVLLGVFQPTFLYESIFLVLLGTLLLVVDKRRSLAPGQLMGLYVAGYPVGRIVIEKMRTDEAELIFGQRLNVWTSIVVFLLGVWIIWYTGRRAARADAEDRRGGATRRDRRAAAGETRSPRMWDSAAQMARREGLRRYPSGTWPEPSAPDLAVPGPSAADDPEDGDAT